MKIDYHSIDYKFGQILRKIREERNMSQMEFADYCGISAAYYGRAELGRHSFSVKLCYKISQSLGMRLSDLFEDIVD